MIAYNKTWLANLRLQTQLKKQLNKGCITDAEFGAIQEKYPVEFYTPNLFVRIGLIILTCVIVLFGSGLLTLMTGFDAVDKAGWYFFLGALTYIGLELIVYVKHHYRSGVDNALLFISGCMFSVGFTMMLFHNEVALPLSLFIFIISLVLTLRFTDILMAAISCGAFFAFIFFGWMKIVPSGLNTEAFVMMLVSVGVYLAAVVSSKKSSTINYENCLVIVQVISLITLYAAGNYYVVQTLGSEFNSSNITAPKALPFGGFFWALTILLPFIYLGLGIRKKNATLLRIGLILIAAAAITFHAYYHILPLDIMLTIVGATVLGISYAIMKYLKNPKHGFTYAEQDDSNMMDNLKVESLIVAETFAKAPAAPANDGAKFGGGDFGGGGSSDSF
ncbi:hypothetical protein ACPPVU_01720 [Mucilaginibacter sp. McL0603]|uniref:hypothetical protein n=1 Tax=Mucilaginibacter sp. McL0603 TaxID=3415670 RepID=UPI003CF8B7B6